MEDINELKEFLGTDEGKAAFTEAGYRDSESIAGLENKKNELLGKVKRNQEDKQKIIDVYKKYDIIDEKDLAEKLGTISKSKANETELEKAMRRIEIIEKTANEANERASLEKSRRATSEKKAQIITALKEAHVNDVSLEVLESFFSGITEVEEDESGKISVIVQSDDGQSPLKSYIKDWSKTEQAKSFIRAPGNSGGGASGSSTGSEQSDNLEEIAKLPEEQRIKRLTELGYIK